MSRFLRRRSNTATSTLSSPPPAQMPRSPDRVMDANQEAQQVRLEVYLNHWQQIQAVVDKGFNTRFVRSKISSDDVQTVVNYATQMMHLLVEEEAPSQGTIGRLLEILIQEDMLEKLYMWTERAGEVQEDAKAGLLRIYELIIGQCKQSVLMHPAVLNPLLRLLLACWEHSSDNTQQHLIPLLQALCISLSKDPNLLEFLFHASPSKGPAKFLLFSLLIPYIHREGLLGQQARDALLLCISVSAEAKNIGKYIADSTNLCPVLAAGLGALYSDLPGKLDIKPDHWDRLTQEDVSNMPELAMFLNSLEFCNAVVQVAHPLISEQLIQFFHDGFLVPVIGPALHQLDREAILLRANQNRPFSHSDLLLSTTDLNLNEEIVAATAYVELFLRSISDQRLMRTFLRFLCLGFYDSTLIMDTLIKRIHSKSKLCLVTLSLFKTLLDVNCEDVMIELILRYLVPCTHVMASQRKAIRDLDFYGKWAEKFLSLSPACSKQKKEVSDKGSSKGSRTDLSSRSLVGQDVGDAQSNGLLSVVRLTSKGQVTVTGTNQNLNNGFSVDSDPLQQNGHGRLTPDHSTASNASRNSDSDTISQASRVSSNESVCEIDSSHIEYLLDARTAIAECSKSCTHWTLPYDGCSPHPMVLSPDIENAGSDPDDRYRFSPTQRNSISKQSTPRHESNSDAIIDERTLDMFDDQPEQMQNRSVESKKDNALAGTFSSTIEEVLQMSIGDGGDGRDLDSSDVSLAEIFPGEKLSIVDLVDSMEQKRKEEAEASESQEDSSQAESLENGATDAARHSFQRTTPFTSFDRSVLSDDSQTSKSRHDSAFEFDEPGVFWQFDSDMEVTPNRRLQSSGSYFYDESFEPLHSAHENGDFQHLRNGLLDSGDFSNSFHTNGTSSLASPLSFGDIDESHFSMSEAETSSRGSSPVHDPESPKGTKSASGGTSTPQPNIPRPAGLTLASSNRPSSFTPITKSSGAPPIGPFMMSIFSKLDAMMENSLYVNLLLTGIISRLACYPQPLLRSFLLNTNMVFQPTVRSLMQVLTSVKGRLDAYATQVDNWDLLLHRAKQYLTTREAPDDQGPGRDRSVSMIDDRSRVQTKARSGTITLTTIKQVTRRASLADMFLKRRNRAVKTSEKQKLTAIRESGVGAAENSPNSTEVSAQYESVKSRNAVYCAVVLDEFVKELSALAQEHAVLYVENL